ncbi:unnamed protein product [Caenorhabditis sp. 36 PRJEB53466]|nr:unnamed protein product [Caenorhabditis sp. 36 PRJEB53466]
MQFYMYVTTSVALISWIFFDIRCAGNVLAVSFFFAYFIAVTVTSVQNILLFVLSLRRFVILFFPNFKKFISIDPKTFRISLRSLYAFYVGIQILTKVIKIFCGTDSMVQSGLLAAVTQNDSSLYRNETTELVNHYDQCAARTDSIYVRIYLIGDILVMTAAVLYCIMFIKVRRWSRMTGDLSNHPEKYIFYQTFFLSIAKLLALTIILVASLQYEYSDDSAFTAFVISDVTTTPFVIQVSYILCNRANVDALLSIQFKKFRTWLVLICGAEPKGRPKRRRNAALKYNQRNKVRDSMKAPEVNTVSNHRELPAITPVVIVIPMQKVNKRRDTIS